MIQAEHRQQQPREHRDNASAASRCSDSDDVAIKLEMSFSERTDATSQLEGYQLQQKNEEAPVGSQSVVVVAQVKERVVRQLYSEDESSEERLSSSESSTSSSDAEIEDALASRLKDRGWLKNVQPSLPSGLPVSVQHEINGVPLPVAEPAQYGSVHVKNAGNVHVGNKAFYKGPVTIKQIVYTNTTSLNEDKSNLGSGADDERLDKRTADGPKLSNSSSHSLYPFHQSRFAEWFGTKRCAITLIIAALILALIIILSVLLPRGTDYSTNPSIPVSPNDSSINNDPTISGIRIVWRVEWGAQPPVHPPKKLGIFPPTYVIISHTATTFCYTQAQCVLNVRVAQTFHIESKGWDDIGYNFLVGGDGLIYEGRGWDVEGAHTFNYNYKSIGISFIGTFTNDTPTKAQLYAAQKLIEYGLKNGCIANDYKLLGHRQCIKTESPGQKLYEIIQTWEHWSPAP